VRERLSPDLLRERKTDLTRDLFQRLSALRTGLKPSGPVSTRGSDSLDIEAIVVVDAGETKMP
jgi:hypothetical protein